MGRSLDHGDVLDLLLRGLPKVSKNWVATNSKSDGGFEQKKNFPSKLRILLSFTYPLVNVYIANWKDPPFFIGKTHYFYDHVPQLFVCLPEGEFPWHPINPMENPRKNGHCFREFSHSKCSLVEASFTQTGCVIRHQETEWPLCIGRSVPSSPGLRQADAK